MKKLLKLVLDKDMKPFSLSELQNNYQWKLLAEQDGISAYRGMLADFINSGYKEQLHDGGWRIFIPIRLG